MLDPNRTQAHLTPVGSEAPQPPEMQGIFEPPSSFLTRAIFRSKLLVLACAIVLALAAALVGRHKAPVYTAATTIQVGTPSSNSAGFDGFVVAATSLANVYSRGIEATDVLRKVEHETGLPAGVAHSRLTAEPVPESPSFRVFATAASGRAAIELVNVASEALIEDENEAASKANPQVTSLLKENSKATERLENATARVQKLTAEENIARGEGQQITGPGPKLVRARIALNEAKVRQGAIEQAYRTLVSADGGQGSGSGLLQMVAAASSASNNHGSKEKTYGLIGLLAGAVIGCLLALGRESLRLRGRVGSESGLRATEAG